jgi:DNA-binding transcriptional LysR family regulator
MDITIRQLRTIREIARLGTIAAAAESLGYTPSAVSQQMAALESAVGVDVLERIGRGVRLTDAGRSLVDRADSVLASIDETRAEIEQVSGTPVGSVRVAVFESFAAALLPQVIAQVRAAHPDVTVRSVQLDPEDAVEELLRGSCDLALVVDYAHAPSPRPRGIEWRVLRQEPFRLVVPFDDEITGPVELASLADRPFIAGSLDTSCGRCTMNACRDSGFEPDIHHEIDQTTAALRAVASGAGVTLLPDLALVDAPPGVKILDLVRPLHRTIELAARPVTLLRPAAQAVVAAVDEVMAAPSSRRAA